MDLIGRKQKIFQVRIGRGLKTLTSTTETRDLTNDKQVIIFDSCRCGTTLHNPKEVFATCVGGESLCSECSKTRCGLCNRIICPDHTNKSKIIQTTICSFHSLSEIMLSKLWK